MSNTLKNKDDKEFNTVNEQVLYIIRLLLKQTTHLPQDANLSIDLTVEVNEDEY